MEFIENGKVGSQALNEFAQIMQTDLQARPRSLSLNQDNVRNGLARLVLTIIKLLHELLEREAIRRMESGSLTEEQTEQLGFTLMRQAQEIEALREAFGLREEDLNLDLGPLGRLFEGTE